MVQPRTDRVDASIHMLFMEFDLAVIWLDDLHRVVDVKHCRRWNPVYIPIVAAKFVLETHLARLADYHIGDQLRIQPCD